jgi:hypothetical protein
MITFWVDRPGAQTIQNYLVGQGEPIKEHFGVRVYDLARETIDVSGGSQIFAALDQLSEPERNAVGTLQDRLAELQPGMRLLNDPRRCLLRPALLDLMSKEGINSFKAYPAHEFRTVSRFPVFVRGAHEHDGSLTGLLGSSHTLRRALLALRFRGHRLSDLLIVEFCDTSDQHGVFRKYAAMRVGDAIVPIHLFAGRHWIVKGEGSERTVELGQEALRFVEGNPHASWLRQVFAHAGIEFGRVDYSVLEGRPQLWEINLNPTLGRRRMRPAQDSQAAEVWKRTRELAHSRLREAFAALDRGPATEGVSVTLGSGLRGRIIRVVRRKRRRELALRLLSRTYDSPLGAPLRAALTRLVPRQ